MSSATSLIDDAVSPWRDSAVRRAVDDAYDKYCTEVLARQCRDGSDNDGGFFTSPNWCDGRESAYALARLIGYRCSAGHTHWDEPIRRAAVFLVRRQSPDGMLDLGGVYTPNEAGFPVPGLVAGYARLRHCAPELFEALSTPLSAFFHRVADALLAGHPYTANHRWAAVCAPLAAIGQLWPDERYSRLIDQYLTQGVDCDESGVWFEERSPNYNMVANHGMLVLADRLNRPDLRGAVVRNAEWMLHQIQPNEEADSSFSFRQDRGAANCPAFTFSVARRVAILTGDGRYTTLALRALKQPSRLIQELMPVPLELDQFPGEMPEPCPLPLSYERYLAPRHLARIRQGNVALTLAADPGGHFFDLVRDSWGGVRRSDDWIHAHFGDVVLQSLVMSPAGQFGIQPNCLEQQGSGRYRLSGFVDGWQHTLHFLPGHPSCFMPWNTRHEIEVTVKEDQISLRIEVATPQALIGLMQLWVRPGIEIREASRVWPDVKPGQDIALAGGHPVELVGKRGRVTLSGLPPAQHGADWRAPEPVPSSARASGVRLRLGLRLPVELHLTLTPVFNDRP